MTQDFYRAFEDRFRGSREEILSRLSVYLPWIHALKANVASNRALDIGCGRGEWLELLVQAGVQASGVDLDAGMLADCHAKSLTVEQRDGIEALAQAADNSLALVSAFHVVEHLPFDQVRELIAHAHRALVPGGLLLMETPNSENIGVGTWNFYLDPTHQRPVPHLLLEFATQYAGFESTHVLRLNHDPQIAHGGEIGLLDVLCRASPDYAVVGMKSRPDKKTSNQIYGDCLAENIGLSLQTLANRYDDKYSGAIRSLDADLYTLRAQFENFQQVEAKLMHQFSNSTDDAKELTLERFIKARKTVADRLDTLERQQQAEIDHLRAQGEQHAQILGHLQAELAHNQLERTSLAQQLNDVHKSSSWRLTKPLRALVSAIKRVLGRHD